MTIYDELVARGLIAQVTDEKEIKELINNGKATFYIGKEGLEFAFFQDFVAHGRASERNLVVLRHGGSVSLRNRHHVGIPNAGCNGVRHGLGIAGACPIDHCCLLIAKTS